MELLLTDRQSGIARSSVAHLLYSAFRHLVTRSILPISTDLVSKVAAASGEESLPPKPTYSYDNYAEELKQKLRATQQLAKAHLNEAKIRAKNVRGQGYQLENFQDKRQSSLTGRNTTARTL